MADTDVTRIAGNIGAMNALYALNNINKQLSVHQTRLATGKRINSAADDPAGLAISTKMLSRSESLKTALSNIGDAKNLLAVAESGLGRLTDILNSMRTITENAANDTNGTDERTIVKEQLLSYSQQINDIVEQTKWSDKKLIDGSYDATTDALTFQTGADVGETTKLSGLTDMHALALHLLSASVAASDAALSTTAIGTGLTASMSTTFTTELASGTYTVETTFSTTEAGAYTAHIMSGTTVVGTATGTYADGTTQAMNFNNGLVVTLASSGIFTAGTAASAAIGTDFGTNVTAATVALGTQPALVLGTYDLSVTIASADNSYTAIFGTGTAAITMTGTYVATGTPAIDFGNGVSITLANSINLSSADYTEVGTLDYDPGTADAYSVADSSSFTYTASQAAVAAGVNITQTTVGTVTTSLSSDFSAYMSIIDAAMVSVNSQLSKIGSLTGSLTFKEDQISSSQINVEASYNRIMNANMAEEQVNASKLLILQQTSTAMLAQANAAPQFLLSLFQ
jgi:flagellin